MRGSKKKTARINSMTRGEIIRGENSDGVFIGLTEGQEDGFSEAMVQLERECKWTKNGVKQRKDTKGEWREADVQGRYGS